MSKLLIAFIIIITLLVGGYFVMQRQQPKSPQAPEKLTLAMFDNPTFALVLIAQNKGFFKDDNLEITYRKIGRGIDNLADALKGNSDLGWSYETPAVRKIYEGEKLRIVTTLHTSTKNVGLTARKDKGITVATDLRGKKIGVPKNSAYEFFLYSFLLSRGVKLSEATFVDGDFANMAPLLKDGKVDAVAIGNPWFHDIVKEYPPESLSIFQSEVYTENGVLAGREDIVIRKKEAIVRFLRALVRAENLYKTDNQQALDAVIAELPTVSEETIRNTWNQFTPTLRLDNVLLTLLNREGQWFKDNGTYKTEVPDFRKAIFTDYLSSVKPSAVTLY